MSLFRRSFFHDICHCNFVEKVSEASKLKQDLKEEKQTRKRIESKAERVEEEISDLRHEKESLEKVCCVLSLLLVFSMKST